METERETGRLILIGYDVVEELIREIPADSFEEDDDGDDWCIF